MHQSSFRLSHFLSQHSQPSFGWLLGALQFSVLSFIPLVFMSLTHFALYQYAPFSLCSFCALSSPFFHCFLCFATYIFPRSSFFIVFLFCWLADPAERFLQTLIQIMCKCVVRPVKLRELLCQ